MAATKTGGDPDPTPIQTRTGDRDGDPGDRLRTGPVARDGTPDLADPAGPGPMDPATNSTTAQVMAADNPRPSLQALSVSCGNSAGMRPE